MKNLMLLTWLSCLLLGWIPTQADPNEALPITAGPWTDIHISMRDKLTTKRSEQGDTFEAELASDLIRRGYLIAPKGTPVKGRVLHLQEGQRKPQEIRAEIELTLTHIEIEDEWVSLETRSLMLQTERNFSGLKVGGATAVGAGIFGFKGAAVGSLIGLGWAVITNDQQIRIRRRAELILRLRRAGKLKRTARHLREG